MSAIKRESAPRELDETEKPSISVRGLNQDVRNRLRAAIEAFGSVASVAKELGISASALGENLSGGRQPRASLLAAIAKLTGHSLDWIMFGEEAINGRTQSRSEGREASNAEVVVVPYYDVRASAGPGSMPLDEKPSARLDFDRRVMSMLGVSPANAAFLTVQGDSGLPTIASGDAILIDRSMAHLRDGCLYVIGIDDDVVVKRVERQADRSVLLKSDNPNYSPQHVSAADAEHLRVIGRVRWAFHQI